MEATESTETSSTRRVKTQKRRNAIKLHLMAFMPSLINLIVLKVA